MYIDIWVDGGCSRSIGLSSIGVVAAVEVNGELVGVCSFAKALPADAFDKDAEYAAEYEAFLEGMRRLKEILIEHGFNPKNLAGEGTVLVNFFINSAMVYNQLRGDWAMKAQSLKGLYLKARKAFDEYKSHESIHVALYKAAGHEVRFATNAGNLCVKKVKVLT